MDHRIEHDGVGEKQVPRAAYWGVHTQRGIENFSLIGVRVSASLVAAYALVKKACAVTNRELGFLDSAIAEAVSAACDEIIAGRLADQFPLDALQGGAGTSLNMNLNEVIANRAGELLGGALGAYDRVHPIDHVNLHQSTNDTFPTALKVAVWYKLRVLSDALAALQGALQDKEKEFAGIIKVGRTEMQEAVPMTLGAQFSGFAAAVGRDRWRAAKCEERIRTVNLGTTAIGTGMCAPRPYIFRVVDTLRELSGLGVARAENGVDQTSNADAFAEVAGILDACAVNMVKISNDLRLLNLLGEISLEPVQTGSSIMPGKVNPVLLEAVVQAGFRVMANGSMVDRACAAGTQQINEFLPLIAHGMLESLDLLANAARTATRCYAAIRVREESCTQHVSYCPSVMTALVPMLGYQRAQELIRQYKEQGQNISIREYLADKLDTETVDKIFSPVMLTALGYEPDEPHTPRS